MRPRRREARDAAVGAGRRSSGRDRRPAGTSAGSRAGRLTVGVANAERTACVAGNCRGRPTVGVANAEKRACVAGERRGRPTVPPGGAGATCSVLSVDVGAGRERIRQVAAPATAATAATPPTTGTIGSRRRRRRVSLRRWRHRLMWPRRRKEGGGHLVGDALLVRSPSLEAEVEAGPVGAERRAGHLQGIGSAGSGSSVTWTTGATSRSEVMTTSCMSSPSSAT